MARPKASDQTSTVQQRLERALVELVQVEPLEQVTIAELTAKAGCSRGTFYYHYADVYDLFEQVVTQRIPVEMLSSLLAELLSGGGFEASSYARLAAQGLEAHQDDFAEIGLLLGSKAGDRVRAAVKERVLGLWSASMDAATIEGDLRLLFELGFNGIVGILAYAATSGAPFDHQRYMRLIAPELPQAFASCFAKCM